MERKKAQLAKKKISDDLRTSRGSSYQIPFDLIPDILKGLPVKTLGRFLCVSKQFASIIRNKDFKKQYALIKSSSRPQSLIFTFDVNSYKKRFFFSASHDLKNGGESSSSLATYHMNCDAEPYKTVAPSVHGLICYGPPKKLKVYNPSTRRSVTLPKIDSMRLDMYHYLGYDPIDGDYKVLCMTKDGRGLAQELRVLTYGNGNSWRMIQDCPPHSPESLEICIKGVLYYEAFLDTDHKYQAVMSFDVRSEKFDLIRLPETATFTKLISYEGKLAVMSFTPARHSSGKIDLWFLVDAAKHEWSNKVFALGLGKTEWYLEAFSITDAGEIVLGPKTSYACSRSFYVLYYDPKKNSVRKVYIERLITKDKLQLWDKATTSIFSSQVENLMFL